MREDQTLFTMMIDEVIELGEDDPELKEGEAVGNGNNNVTI